MINTKTIFVFSMTLLMISGCFKADDEMKDTKPLVVSKTCLPVTNECEITLEGDVKLRMHFKATPSYQRLLPVTLETSGTEIQSAAIALHIDGEKMPSEDMKLDNDNKNWQAQLLPFADVTNDNIKVRLLVTYKDSRYFAEIPVRY